MRKTFSMTAWTFLLGAALPAFGQADRPSVFGNFSSLPRFRSQIVSVSHDKATEELKVNAEVVRQMVDAGIRRVTGEATVAGAWLSLVSTNDVVGIKVYTAASGMAGTRVETVSAVVEGLITAGLPPDNIIVWDRRAADLLSNGYGGLRARSGIRLADATTFGYDEDHSYEKPLIGNLVWDDKEFGQEGDDVGRQSFVSRLVTEQATKLINITPALNNPYSGTSGNLFSLSFGSVDNTRRFQSSPGMLAEAVAEIYAMKIVGDRVVMNITDALICQFAGQTEGLLHYSRVQNEIRFSTDPVALDVLALDHITSFRKAAGMTTTGQNRAIYANAELLQLGTTRLNEVLLDEVSLTAREDATDSTAPRSPQE